MKVHKNLLGTNNDKIHVDEIAVALGLLLGDAVIVEHGSNSNGKYTKFGNGLMICEKVIDFNQTTSETVGNLYRTPTPINTPFPAVFIEEPYVDASLITPVIGWAALGSGHQNWSAIRVYSSANNQTIDKIRLFAFGRWK